MTAQHADLGVQRTDDGWRVRYVGGGEYFSNGGYEVRVLDRDESELRSFRLAVVREGYTRFAAWHRPGARVGRESAPGKGARSPAEGVATGKSLGCGAKEPTTRKPHAAVPHPRSTTDSPCQLDERLEDRPVLQDTLRVRPPDWSTSGGERRTRPWIPVSSSTRNHRCPEPLGTRSGRCASSGHSWRCSSVG